ncbi:MAG TPA: DUF2179 domain-containing protein [Thermoanaerobaculia bacterium]|nr:DUF2179 domain-containing protein [Thermoanaerobaculia bacterium]
MPVLDSTLWPLLGIPLLIFCARMGDVTLSTLRIILISRGMKRIAPFVGFFEVMIWLFAISQAMKHLDHWYNYVAYAGGFAAGTWLGIFLEGRLALGLQSVQIITSEDASGLIDRLRTERFGVTDFAARGIRGNVRLILTVIRRKDLDRVLSIVRTAHPTAFISILDVRSVSEGFFARRTTNPLLQDGRPS